jgi:hypothetical protein
MRTTKKIEEMPATEVDFSEWCDAKWDRASWYDSKSLAWKVLNNLKDVDPQMANELLNAWYATAQPVIRLGNVVKNFS